MHDPSSVLPELVAVASVSATWVWPIKNLPGRARALWLLGSVAASAALGWSLGWPTLPSRELTHQIVATLMILFLGTVVAGSFIARVLALLRLQAPSDIGGPGAGQIIGILERLLLISVFPIGGAEAVALVFAAKQIARLPSLQRAQDTSAAAEYVLVGSLLSVVVGLIGGLALSYVVK